MRQLPAIVIAALGLVAWSSIATPQAHARVLDDPRTAMLLTQLGGHGATGVLVVDAATGEELIAVAADEPLNPASNVKLISTATVLDLLGPDYRFATRVLGAVPGADGGVETGIYVRGTFDPTLDGDAIADLVRQLQERGVRQIAGDVVVGARRGRDGVGRAVLRIEICAGRPGDPARVTVHPAGVVDLDVRVTTERRGGSHVGVAVVRDDSVAGRPRLVATIEGTIRAGRRLRRDVAIDHRSIYTARLLASELRRAGIEVGGIRVEPFRRFVEHVVSGGSVLDTLAEHHSAPVHQLIGRVNKYSANRLADQLVLAATAITGNEPPAMGDAVAAMYAWLDRAGVGTDDMMLDTGSGLSYATKLSPRQIVGVLATAIDRPAYRASLAIAGVDGTLRRRLRHAPAVIAGKTGTLDDALALSGVIEVNGEPALLFSIVTNGERLVERRRAIRRAHDRFVDALADLAVARAGL
jgi:D-alanyl-D-alanine carboxypeptidase/D-alanyl-D-alanine-endopeptidase (penicillin-binding protein 4)